MLHPLANLTLHLQALSLQLSLQPSTLPVEQSEQKLQRHTRSIFPRPVSHLFYQSKWLSNSSYLNPWTLCLPLAMCSSEDDSFCDQCSTTAPACFIVPGWFISFLVKLLNHNNSPDRFKWNCAASMEAWDYSNGISLLPFSIHTSFPLSCLAKQNSPWKFSLLFNKINICLNMLVSYGPLWITCIGTFVLQNQCVH